MLVRYLLFLLPTLCGFTQDISDGNLYTAASSSMIAIYGMKKFYLDIKEDSSNKEHYYTAYAYPVKVIPYKGRPAVKFYLGIKEDSSSKKHRYTAYAYPPENKDFSLNLLKTSLKLGLLPKDYLVNLPDSVKSQLCSEIGSSLYVYSGDKGRDLAYSKYEGRDLAYSKYEGRDLAYSRDKTNKSLDYLIKWCRAHY